VKGDCLPQIIRKLSDRIGDYPMQFPGFEERLRPCAATGCDRMREGYFHDERGGRMMTGFTLEDAQPRFQRYVPEIALRSTRREF